MTTPALLSVGNEASYGTADVELIFVPEKAFKDPIQWAVKLLTRFQSQSPGLKIVARVFRHEALYPSKSLWDQLLEQGSHLLTLLSDQRNKTTEKFRPIMFICHGLGGIIVKHAICITHAQNMRFGDIATATTGVIFMSTPHRTSSGDGLKNLCLLILKSVPSTLSKELLSALEQSEFRLDDISALFGEINPMVEILTVFEGLQTKIKEPRLIQRSKSMLLVGKEVATIGLSSERRIPLSNDHVGVSLLEASNGSESPEISEWIRACLRDSNDIVSKRLELVERAKDIRPPMTKPMLLESEQKELEVPQLSREAVKGSSTSRSGQLSLERLDISRADPAGREAKLPCFMVEDRLYNSDFFGRKHELELLDNALLPSEAMFDPSETSRPKQAAICGFGGLGKSEIAIQFVFTRRAKFDAIFWLQSDQLSILQTDISRIASKLQLGDDDELQNDVISMDLAKGWLSHPVKKNQAATDLIGQDEAKWLIVFDNADDPHVLDDYWPLFQYGSVLITSRDPVIKTSFPSAHPLVIELDPFEPKEAAAFLHKASRRNTEPEDALAVALELGCVPLALSQMAGIIRYQVISFNELLTRYNDTTERGLLQDYEADKRRPNARGNIASIYAVNQLSQEARTILEIASVLDPDVIQERIFADYNVGLTLIHGYPKNNFEYSRCRSQLLRSSLLQRDEVNKRFSIHRLVRSSVQTQMEKRRFEEIFSGVTELLTLAWGSKDLTKRHTVGFWENRGELFPHISSLLRLYNNLSAGGFVPSISLAALLGEAGWWRHEKASWGDSRPFYDAAFAICKGKDGVAVEDTSLFDDPRYDLLSDLHYGLGAVAFEGNDPKTCMDNNAAFYRMRAKKFQSTGTQDLRLAIAQNQIGLAYAFHDRYVEAEPEFLSSIQTYRKLEDYWECMESNPLVNCAQLYLAMGKVEKASKMLEEGLLMREKRFGYMDKDSLRTGRFLTALGDVRYLQGRAPESDAFYERAILQLESTVGKYHHRTADAYYKNSKAFLRKDDLPQASDLIEKAIKTWSLEMSSFLPQLARAIFVSSVITDRRGATEDAKTLLRQAADLRRKILQAQPISDDKLQQENFDALVVFASR